MSWRKGAGVFVFASQFDRPPARARRQPKLVRCVSNSALRSQIFPGGCATEYSMASSKFQSFWNHPAGPKTIHFWAPTFKWGISIANVADFSKPPEKLSYPQQIAVTCTGIIWSRYSTVITPKNWNLFSVNIAMACTGIYQLSRKIQQDYSSGAQPAVAKE